MDTEKTPTLTANLDRTSIAKLPDDKLLALGLTQDEIKLLRSMPETQLSSMVPVSIATGKGRAKEIQAQLDFDPEIDYHGNRLCVYVDAAGHRCDKYGSKDIPVCAKHKTHAASIGTYFRSPKLRETYNAFMNSPEKLRCDGELALMRTMLSTVIAKITDDNANLEIIGAVISISDKITNTIDRMAKLEKVTPEQLDVLMKKMVEVAAKYIPADKLTDFAKDVEGIDLEDRPLRTVTGLPFIPDEPIADIQQDDKPDRDVQRRALEDIAQRMGVTADG
jgi:hypothetical protein